MSQPADRLAAEPVLTDALRGRRVLVTRPRPQAGRFVRLLERYGAEVVSLPAIEIGPPDDLGPLDVALGELDRFRWVVFTSVNGVAAVLDRLTDTGRDAGLLRGRRLAAIGPETAEALRRAGLSPELVPEEFRAEGLVEAFRGRVTPGDEVLLPRAAEARDVLPRELSSWGVRVRVVAAYRTVLAAAGAAGIRRLLAERGIDAVTFTSSSTVRGFLGLLGETEATRLLEGVVLAAIGPVTAATLVEYGLRATVVPGEYTVPALAVALAQHFGRSHTPGGGI